MTNPVIAGSFRIAPDHPSLPGHFPGRPVVPGVLLLDEVIAAIAPHRSGTVSAMPSVKFLRPVLPGEDVEVSFDPERVAFTCTVGGVTVASGRVT